MSAPLVTPRGDLVGVVQLVNKLPYPKRPEAGSVPDFDARDERVFNIVAGQAALAIENSMLLEEQERLLEGFVNACVTAVEARDPVTSGHSNRVSEYSVAHSEAVSRTNVGRLKEVTFNEIQLREIRYAAMLHDIGKISVREEVLNKEKKLHGYQLEIIHMRLKLMRANLKLKQAITREDLSEQVKQIENAWAMIRDANEPNVLPAAVNTAIQGLVRLEVQLDDGEFLTALTNDEGFKLAIPKGSLSEEERVAIELHVTNSFHILKMVPWSRGLEHVPEIAYRHHEKLDGSGYPCKCHAPEIPLQSRILTICDIYDALTADDRPYKRALPLEKALDILGNEVKHGKLDKECFDVFVEAKIFDVCKPSRGAYKKAA
jgi:HD-GYP domain-containing protein (c-di-GMP phosphodiesterase class II)